ncbi:MAG: RDD family protein [Haloglomus sp.]
MPSRTPVKPTNETTDVVGARIGAQVVDVIVMFLQLVVVAVALVALSNPGPGAEPEAYVLVAAFTLPFYGGVLESYWNGQTLGKRLTGVKVVDRSGEPPSLGAALLRNVPAVVVFSWLTTAVGLAAIAMDDRNQRVFDDVADTYVVDASPTATRQSDLTASSRARSGRPR